MSATMASAVTSSKNMSVRMSPAPSSWSALNGRSRPGQCRRDQAACRPWSKSTRTAGVAGAVAVAATAALASLAPNGMTTNTCGCITGPLLESSSANGLLRRERTEVLLHVDASCGGGAILQQQLHMLAIGFVHFSHRFRTDVGKAQQTEPFFTQINVIAGNLGRPCLISWSSGTRGRSKHCARLPSVGSVSRHHVEHFAVNHLAIG